MKFNNVDWILGEENELHIRILISFWGYQDRSRKVLQAPGIPDTVYLPMPLHPYSLDNSAFASQERGAVGYFRSRAHEYRPYVLQAFFGTATHFKRALRKCTAIY